jgi:integral membrane protein (TIGR01906 family)
LKIIRILLWWIFILSIPVLLISTVVRVEVQCLPFYEYEYEKYNISEVTGFDSRQLGIITRHLIQFFNGKVESAQLVVEKNNNQMYLFHDHEIVHLEDVKEIFQYVYKIQLISMAYFLFYLLINIIFRKRKKLIYFWKGLKNGSILTIGLLITLGVGAFFGFHQLFIQFHYLVFGDPQSSPWILDPRTDHLVMMYPLNFWQDALMLGILAILTTSVILIGLSWLFSIKYHHSRR